MADRKSTGIGSNNRCGRTAAGGKQDGNAELNNRCGRTAGSTGGKQTGNAESNNRCGRTAAGGDKNSQREIKRDSKQDCRASLAMTTSSPGGKPSEIEKPSIEELIPIDDGWFRKLLETLTIDGIPYEEHPMFQPRPGFQEELWQKLLKQMDNPDGTDDELQNASGVGNKAGGNNRCGRTAGSTGGNKAGGNVKNSADELSDFAENFLGELFDELLDYVQKYEQWLFDLFQDLQSTAPLDLEPPPEFKEELWQKMLKQMKEMDWYKETPKRPDTR